MPYYETCPECGSHLDPGEKCDCEREQNYEKARKKGAKSHIKKGADNVMNANPSTSPKTIQGFKVIGCVRSKHTGGVVPMVDIPMVSDIQWVEDCIKSREDHPEYYPNEDIPEVIARSKALLKQLHREEAAGTEKQKRPSLEPSKAKG